MAVTTNFGITKPTVGADAGLWGGLLNSALDTLDTELWDVDNNSVKTKSVTVTNNVTAVSPIGSGKIHLIGRDDGIGSAVQIDGIGNAGWFVGRIALGTAAAPSAVLSGAYLAALAGRGYLATGYSANDLGQIAIQAEENYTNSTAATGIIFCTTPAGNVGWKQVARIDNGGRLMLGEQTAGGLSNMPASASVGIELKGTTRAILFSRLTTGERDALSVPQDGMVLYNTSTNKLQVRAAGSWVDLH